MRVGSRLLGLWIAWRAVKRLGSHRPSPERTITNDDPLAQLLVDRATWEIGVQLGDSDTLDLKALGLLAVDVAAFAATVAVHDSLNRFWWAAGVLFAIAGVVLYIVVWPRQFDFGPDVGEFYETMRNESLGESYREMLTQLIKAIRRNNTVVLPSKMRWFIWGFRLLLTAGGAAVASALIGG